MKRRNFLSGLMALPIIRWFVPKQADPGLTLIDRCRGAAHPIKEPEPTFDAKLAAWRELNRRNRRRLD